MFVLQNAPMGEFELPAGLKLEPLESELETAKFDLMLTMSRDGDGVDGVVRATARTCLTRRLMARMLEHLASVAGSSQWRIRNSRCRALPLLTEAERQQLLEWNETAAEYPREQTIHNCSRSR